MTPYEALTQAAEICENERALWKSTRTPLPDDVEGGRSAAKNCAVAILALRDSQPQESVQNDTPARGATMDIDKLVDRFLSWKLPKDFSPDGGISFVPSKTHPDMWPIGTNLFTADQAKEMLAHITGPLQAKLDRLMLEYCPDEMTPGQMENWGKHQRPVTPEQEAAVQRAVQSESVKPDTAKVPEGVDLVGWRWVPTEVYDAAVALVPLLEDGWDGYDDTADVKAGTDACDRLIAAVNAMLAAAPSPSESEQPINAAKVPQNWAVFCGICDSKWSVPYHHPGKSICDECVRKYATPSPSGVEESK